MTDRPILFSAPMVRAILDGRKTQTRRVIKGVGNDNCMEIRKATKTRCGLRTHVIDAGKHNLLPFAVGDRLWVRETWAKLDDLGHNDPGTQALSDGAFYAAGNPATSLEMPRWRPSIHMPRWASRLTLEVTDVRVDLLRNISERDAVAEGVEQEAQLSGGREWWVPGQTNIYPKASMAFAELWDGLNPSRGLGWDANPWVCAVTFTAVRCNIDKMRAAA